MKTAPDNPERNVLPKSVSEEDLIRALDTSGYPLQGQVAELLTPDFFVIEEWGYVDSDTKTHRTLDVHAYRNLATDRTVSVKPDMALLIECKRSAYPYVFFSKVHRHRIPDFPRIGGMRKSGVSLRAPGKHRAETTARVLGLADLPFVSAGPPLSAAFSRAVNKGKAKPASAEELDHDGNVRLTGTDPWNTLILPLVKASDFHWRGSIVEGQNIAALYPRLILNISVIDAPMIFVETPNGKVHPTLTPWVRIIRHQTLEEKYAGYRWEVVDAVHADYFPTYVAEHVMPFAREFARRAVLMSEVLIRGGAVDNLETFDWSQIKVAK